MSPREAAGGGVAAPQAEPRAERVPTEDEVEDARVADREDAWERQRFARRSRRDRFNGPSQFYDGDWD